MYQEVHILPTFSIKEMRGSKKTFQKAINFFKMKFCFMLQYFDAKITIQRSLIKYQIKR